MYVVKDSVRRVCEKSVNCVLEMYFVFQSLHCLKGCTMYIVFLKSVHCVYGVYIVCVCVCMLGGYWIQYEYSSNI